MNQTAPLKLSPEYENRPKACSYDRYLWEKKGIDNGWHISPAQIVEQEMQERYALLCATKPEGVELTDLNAARVADTYYINYIDEDGQPQWKVVTIVSWKELGGKIE